MGCLPILVEQAKFTVVYAILLANLQTLNAIPANKCQHKFQPGTLNSFLRTKTKINCLSAGLDTLKMHETQSKSLIQTINTQE